MDNLISFLSGIIIGATGSYFGNKYTDRRREQEAKSKEKQQFLEVVGMMPDLISEMKNDLSKPEQKLIREFFSLRELIPLMQEICLLYITRTIILDCMARFMFWRILATSQISLRETLQCTE